MSSWTTYGLSALSNVTQSVQALSSYAQVVLHEAREEVNSHSPRRVARFCIIPCIRHNNPLQVQAELLGEGIPGALSPAPEDGSDAAVAPAPAPKPFKPFPSPLRPLTAKYSSGADENSATESGRGEGGAGDFDSADDPQEEILQLQVRLLLQACVAIRSKFAWYHVCTHILTYARSFRRTCEPLSLN